MPHRLITAFHYLKAKPLTFWAKLGVTVLLVGLVLKTAWLSDDAYITFRTVDNFLQGYGLTWNVSERVQVYTHPLWMFLMLILTPLTGGVYSAAFLLSLVCLGVSLILLLRATTNLWNILLVGGVLASSKAFIEYSTSGLENVLLGALILAYVTVLKLQPSRLILSFLLVSGILLTRLDALLLVLPLIIWQLWSLRARRWLVLLRDVIIGLLPFIAWELCSLFYYGFLFPNTAYAKLGTGLGSMQLIEQGVRYFTSSLQTDPVTLSSIAVACVVVLRQKDALPKFLMLGVVAYLLYVLKIGGDFMAGRFFAVPVLLSAFVLLKVSRREAIPLLAVIAVGYAIASPFLPLTARLSYPPTLDPRFVEMGVSDERGNYYQGSGLIIQGNALENNQLSQRGRDARLEGKDYLHSFSIGFVGYYAGPEVFILDTLALSDPLLARLPTEKPRAERFFPGHFPRAVPCGYIESRLSGENQICDQNLAQYYERLALITQGPLWSKERLRAIASLNLGRYDHFKDAYLENQVKP